MLRRIEYPRRKLSNGISFIGPAIICMENAGSVLFVHEKAQKTTDVPHSTNLAEILLLHSTHSPNFRSVFSFLLLLISNCIRVGIDQCDRSAPESSRLIPSASIISRDSTRLSSEKDTPPSLRFRISVCARISGNH